jgi:hypothetical protein
MNEQDVLTVIIPPDQQYIRTKIALYSQTLNLPSGARNAFVANYTVWSGFLVLPVHGALLRMYECELLRLSRDFY